MGNSAEKLHPELYRRFLQLQSAASQAGYTLGLGSTYRSVQEQINLRVSNGCPDIWTRPASECDTPTAIPGKSNHNHGLAIDLDGSEAAKEWANRNAAAFGLHFPVAGENWHLEMVDDEASHNAIAQAMEAGAYGFNINTYAEQANPEDELANRLHSMLRIIGMNTSKFDEPLDLEGVNAVEGTGQYDEDFMPEATEAPFPEPNLGFTQSLAEARNFNLKNEGIPTVPSGKSAGEYGNYARSQLAKYGWDSPGEFAALVDLWNRESGDPKAGSSRVTWRPYAQNPGSSAYGIAQFLDGTWAPYGAKTSDPFQQINYGLQYIRDRYGSPTSALRFHDRKNWY